MSNDKIKCDKTKYEKAKYAVREWYSRLEKANNTINILTAEVSRWKKLSEQLPDPIEIEELQHTIHELKKQLSDMEDIYKDKITHLERTKLLNEGKIQQLEDAKRDIQERYVELKQDYREQTRWIHEKK